MRFRTRLVVALTLLAATWLPPCPTCAGQGTADLMEEQETLAALLPGDGAVPGWKRAAPPDFYGPENLWDCINGAAVFYLDYGFRFLVTLYYTTADRKSTAAVEIYRMETPLHAFAIYAAERSPKDNFIKMGVQGYLGDNVLNFWKGPYYTKVASYKTTEEEAILRKLAGNVADGIPGLYSEPEAFRYFPEENRIAGSERYIPKNFLGHPFFRGGYRVDYQGEKRKYQIFLVQNASREEAEKAFGKYREHLEAQDARVSLKKNAVYRMMSAGGRETVFLYGSFVGGVLGKTDEAHALELIDEMVTNLKATAPDSPCSTETDPTPAPR